MSKERKFGFFKAPPTYQEFMNWTYNEIQDVRQEIRELRQKIDEVMDQCL